MVLERQHVTHENVSPEHHCQNSNTKRGRAAPAIYRPPPARRLENVSSTSDHKSDSASKSVQTKTGTRQRRPDIQVYVPRAKRASMVQEAVEAVAPSPENLPVLRQSSSIVRKNSQEVASKCASFHESPCAKKELHNSSATPVKGGNVQFSPNDLLCLRGEKKQKQLCRGDSLCSDHLDDMKVIEKCSSVKVVEESQKGFVKNNLCIDFSCEKEIVPKEIYSGCNDLASSVTELVSDIGCSNDYCKVGNENCDEGAASSIDILNLPSLTFDRDSYSAGLSDNVCPNIEGGHDSECEKNIQDISCDKQPKSGDLTPLTLLPKKDVIDENAEEKKQEEQNRKNSHILRGNFVSDVLIISDPEPLPQTIPPPSPKESPEKCLGDIKKKKSRLKPESVSDAGKDEAPTKTLPSLNPDECTWDMLFDDNGDCLDPKIMDELTRSVGSVAIEKPQSNYDCYITRSEINLPGGDSEFAHVVEIYNFPSEFKTQDLLSVFSRYKNGGFEIKWVDDTHALGVFSSSRVAADVLSYDHPFVKTRPLCEATSESRLKARRSAEFLQPYKTRPETCTALARRLVTGALGMKLNTSREEREAERRLLKEAREKKRLAAQQQQDAWEGTIRDK